MKKEVIEFWNRFLVKTNKSLDTKYIDVFHFELTEKLAHELLELVIIGKKKATASSYLSYKLENKDIPNEGDLSIVTDFFGNPKCIIETKQVRQIPYKDITFEICKEEGEDDTLESWQRGHLKFFKEEGKLLGYEFSDDMVVVFENFEMVYVE